jgi:cytochrome c oxidase cbb3-type subunit I
MVGQLSKNERQIALIILLALAFCGLAMAVAGHDDPLGAHGALVILTAVVGIFFVLAGYLAAFAWATALPKGR